LLVLGRICYILSRGELPQGAALEPSPELLSMLVCPVCRTPVELTADRQGLRCSTCRLIYPIRDGIPVMIKDEARPEAV
jgi:LSD1 subclass zinc finger protein